MKKYIVLITTLITVSISGCGIDKDPNKQYIETDKNKCEKILFTCPQYESIFYNDDGCGCLKTNTTEDNPEARSLVNLVQSYLETRLFPLKDSSNVFAEYLVTDAIENGNDLNYQVLATVVEYIKDKDDNLKETQLFVGPIMLKIEQTGNSYIIYEHELINIEDKKSKEKLSEKTIKIVDNVEKREALIRKMLENIKSTAGLSYAITLKQKLN